jgi:hypothetical protein
MISTAPITAIHANDGRAGNSAFQGGRGSMLSCIACTYLAATKTPAAVSAQQEVRTWNAVQALPGSHALTLMAQSTPAIKAAPTAA